MPDKYISCEAALMKLMQDGCSAKNLQSISDVPAADVAEVVRCRDCKHKVRTDANGIVICSEEHGMYCPTENDFCSYGERREGGNDNVPD